MTSFLSRRAGALLFITALVPLSAAAQRSGSTIGAGQIFAALALKEGLTACEIGAGDAELTIAAARIVGPGGHVYTSELGDDRVKSLRQKVAASGLTHITVVAGDPLQTNFPDGRCDALFMRNVYHHFTDPAAMNASILAALTPGGRVAIVDFTPPGKEADRPADRDTDGMHGISPDTLAREIKDAGFEPEPSQHGTQRWFMIVGSKPVRECEDLAMRRPAVR